MTFDMTAILADIASGLAAVVLVAAAMTGVVYGIKIWRRVRSAG